MRKQNFRVAPPTLAVVWLAATTAAHAADTAQIKVVGAITPGACNVTVDNNGVFDLGRIGTSNLNKTTATHLGTLTRNLQISCSSETHLAIQAVDHVKDSVEMNDGVGTRLAVPALNPIYLYGLGKTTDGTKLGGYRMRLGSPTIDGSSTDTMYMHRRHGSATWEGGLSTENFYEGSFLISWGLKSVRSPQAARTVVIPISVEVAIRPLDHLPRGQQLELRGSTTVSLVYL